MKCCLNTIAENLQNINVDFSNSFNKKIYENVIRKIKINQMLHIRQIKSRCIFTFTTITIK